MEGKPEEAKDKVLEMLDKARAQYLDGQYTAIAFVSSKDGQPGPQGYAGLTEYTVEHLMQQMWLQLFRYTALLLAQGKIIPVGIPADLASALNPDSEPG